MSPIHTFSICWNQVLQEQAYSFSLFDRLLFLETEYVVVKEKT